MRVATKKQREAAKENIKKAQQAWKDMSSEERAKAQPEGKERADVGEKGTGDYYRIVVRDEDQFVDFRYHDVGDKGHIIRLTGKRKSGSWATQAWLISKKDAHMEGEELVPDTKDAKELIESLGSKPEHIEGDIFRAKDRKNVPEKDKPTAKQQKARKENIKKAQEARAKKNKTER